MSESTPSAQNEMPWIVSVDDHVVEPAHLWQSRLPEKYKAKGPRIEILPRGEMKLVDGVWHERPGTGDDMAAWWHYEDHIYQIKQIIACPGIPPSEVKAIGVTYDDIAKGCYDPKARVADTSKLRSASRTTRASAVSCFRNAKTASSACYAFRPTTISWSTNGAAIVTGG